MECVDVATFIGREITSVLKLAVDDVFLELCDSCDYFASHLLQKESCKLLIVLLSYRSYPYVSRRKFN